ncbi:MAG: prolyl oligopeptidase family serine peptidase [Bacteroidales bacterium]
MQKNILVLPGWNFPGDDICNKTDFCKQASREGFVLVMPDMQKSVYSSTIYPETRSDWLKNHTRGWITDSLIPFLQRNLKIFLPEQKNYLMGISTGGRGVALLACYDNANLFRAGAALSGDFDQTLMPDDNLMKGYYGSYQQYPQRWEEEDNPARNACRIRIPLFLAHGTEDKVVPATQTEVFYRALKKCSALPHQLHLVSGGRHDYSFWASQYADILFFFNQN